MTATRDGRTFTTTYTYGTSDYADYGQPTQIVETGELTRTTTVTYKHDFSKYIRGRVASATVTVGGQSYSRSSSYDSTNGFRESSTAFGITTTYTNDGSGNIAEVRDASNRATDYAYEWGAVQSVTTAAGTLVRSLTYDGQPGTEIFGGTVTSYQYDAADRVTSVSDNTPGRTPVTTTYNTSYGHWWSTTVTRGATTVTTDLDGYGRATHSEDSAGVETRVTYDAGGRESYRSRPYGSGMTEVGNSYTYDELNRPLSVTRPDGSTVTYGYAGATTTVTESVSLGVTHVSHQTYLAFGSPGDARLVSVTDAAGGTWNYTYDAIGNLTSVSTPVSGGATRTWAYNSANELISATQPESGTTTFSYDAAGRLVSTTDARGIAVVYSYDGAGRSVLVDAPGTVDDVATTYDANGDVHSVANGTVQSTLTYDTAHRVTGRTDVIAGKTFSQVFTYDGLDALVTATYPITGRTVAYAYDSQGRLTGVTTTPSGGSPQTLANGFTYRGDGALTGFAFGNGLTASSTFDNRLRPLHVTSGPLDITYAYDHVGNVTSITDGRSGYSSTFGYDTLDRLTSVAGYGTTSFTYNGAGDRLTQGTVGGTITFNYDAQHRLSALSGAASGTFSYDGTGSLLSDPSGVTYLYSVLGQLQTSALGGNTTSYAYGPGGSRAVKTSTVDGVPHLYVYGAGGGPIAEYAIEAYDLVLQREYVYVGSQLLASFAPTGVSPPPLSVNIVTPSSGEAVVSGQNVALTANATATGGLTIARVEWYKYGILVGTSTTAPYTTQWNNLPQGPGTYVFTARVVATNNAAVASAPVSITVQ